MKLIIRERFGAALTPARAQEITERFGTELQKCDTLDLDGLSFNYPSMAMLLDQILNSEACRKKALRIVTKSKLSEDHLAQLLFVGSKHFDISSTSSNWAPGEILAKVSRILKENNQSITIIRIDKSSKQQLTEVSYGN